MDPIDFETGPVITETIVAWLDANAKRRTIRLPVEIHASALGIDAAYLSVGDTKVAIRLDTGALSMTLPMHLKPYCRVYPCRVELEGTWGALVPGVRTNGSPVFAVRKVIGLIGPDEAHVKLSK